MSDKKVKFIDLFAGLGGIRLGFEQAFNAQGFQTECVMTSEIKPYAVSTLKRNFGEDNLVGDIFSVETSAIPDFDFLLGGFPCQPFSSGGKRQGFMDTRGTLFFEIERILSEKKPYGFILENVEGLVKHDSENNREVIGRTFSTILDKLENELGYTVSWKVLDAIDFGLPQSRKRVFIVGTKGQKVNLNNFEVERAALKSILECGLETMKTNFVSKLFKHFEMSDLLGKSIKDKRGGENNIHSWEIGLKGEITKAQTILLNSLFKERRRKVWAEQIGIVWMDGMPLTEKQISTFFNPKWYDSDSTLKELLEDLTKKGYLKFEHPKELVKEVTNQGIRTYRQYDISKPKGYNIVSGKLSFEINKILDPNDIAPTLVATDVSRLAVPDGDGLRRLTIREGLRLFGYPETYQIVGKEAEAFDLLGNTVAVPVVEKVATRIADIFAMSENHSTAKVVPVYS